MGTPIPPSEQPHSAAGQTTPARDIAISELHSTHLELPLTERQTGMVDDRQDQLMARDSADGSPPSHRLRVAGWRTLLIFGPLVLIVGVAFAITRGVGFTALALGAVMILGYLVLAGWPVWGAAVLRGGEERVARKEAVVEVREEDL